MAFYTRTLTANGTSAACPHDIRANPFTLAQSLEFSGTGNGTATVQFTLDDLADATDATGAGLTWFDHATLASKTANEAGNIAFPVRATRVVLSGQTGSRAVTYNAIQSGPSA